MHTLNTPRSCNVIRYNILDISLTVCIAYTWCPFSKPAYGEWKGWGLGRKMIYDVDHVTSQNIFFHHFRNFLLIFSDFIVMYNHGYVVNLSRSRGTPLVVIFQHITCLWIWVEYLCLLVLYCTLAVVVISTYGNVNSSACFRVESF